MRKDPFGNELLTRMHYKHGAYWYVHRNKWSLLAKPYKSAVQEWLNRTTTGGSMVPLITKTYDAYGLSVKSGDLKASTMASYSAVKSTLLLAFKNLDPNEVTPSDIKQFISHYYGTKPNVGNRALVVLRAAFELGMDLGMNESNPAKLVKRKVERKRTRRLTDAEFNRIRCHAKSYLPLIMDVLYYTGQRISDVLAIRQSDISGGVLSITQKKTGARIDIEIGPQLDEAISAARCGPVTGLWLFSRNGKPLSYFTVQSAFKAACERAGIPDTTLHDIRSKAITDLSLKGHNPQSLAGHTDPKMTERYIREKLATKAKSLDSY